MQLSKSTYLIFKFVSVQIVVLLRRPSCQTGPKWWPIKVNHLLGLSLNLIIYLSIYYDKLTTKNIVRLSKVYRRYYLISITVQKKVHSKMDCNFSHFRGSPKIKSYVFFGKTTKSYKGRFIYYVFWLKRVGMVENL